MSSEHSKYSTRPTSGVVVLNDMGQVLLIHRTDDGTWGLPGGGVEPGETWSQAAIRECQEETGWLVRIVEQVGKPGDESVAADFFRLDDLPEMLFQPDVPVLECLASKEQGPLIR